MYEWAEKVSLAASFEVETDFPRTADNNWSGEASAATDRL
jgi:hypothetical protein